MNETMSDIVFKVLAASNFYEVLDLDNDASFEEIKTAYRRRVLRCHPDKCPGEKNAAEAFDRIHKAFCVLGDESKRKVYDEMGETMVDANSRQEEQTEIEIRDILLRLSCIVTIPKDELLDDFVTFIRKLCESDEISEILGSAEVQGCFASLIVSMALPLSTVGHCIILALGPAVFGPAVAWEKVLAEFENVTIGGRALNYPLETACSMTRTTVSLTIMWSSLCIALSAHVVTVGAVYTYNIATFLLAKNSSCEDLNDWLLIVLDDSSENISTTVLNFKNCLEVYPKVINGSEWIVINS